jgi:hypothetical protein
MILHEVRFRAKFHAIWHCFLPPGRAVVSTVDSIRGHTPVRTRLRQKCRQRGLHPETRFRPAGRQVPAGLRCAPAQRSFFKSLLCLKVALRMHGTPRHAAEIQLLQQLADAALMQMNIEFGGDTVTRSAQRQRTTPSVLRSGPSSTHFATSLRWASARRG